MLRVNSLVYLQMRLKSQRWAFKGKKTNIQRALESFDDFYGSVFGIRWKNIRVALLTEHKYIAVVNNFGDADKTCNGMELSGALNIKSLVKVVEDRLGHSYNMSINGSNNTLDENLFKVLCRQEEREKQSLYPISSMAETSVQLQHCAGNTTEFKSNSENGENQKFIESLEMAIENNTQLANSRLIDPQYGTGGLYEFMPANKIKGMEDWIPESNHYKYYSTHTDFPLKFELETEFCYPDNLKLYTYEIGNCSEFITPKKCLTDGASVLPPLFLDIKQGERVLDACAAPGGKSLIMLQTLFPDTLICNDIQESRLNRIRKVMQEYIFDYKDKWENKRIIFNQCDAKYMDNYESFDKILVDVPCTTDRHSVTVNDNNIFKSTRIKERLRIPELQADILSNCLRLLKPGGSLIYSTCSLSPVQNDGVVHMALQKAFNENGITATVKDLSYIIRFFEDIFKFENHRVLKYGQLVLPYLPANYGPMYFCKLMRNM
ncbi:PREDICTED: 5-methylcytosine rRNA methyltransferase NSUN4 isoform X2 [Bactrocera latifrons]|uniref:5-methylcytosine rRNA methyltransferase NSUN4 isoform X2 n=1 Tax=Bactrocera latifrons TaxID=174628 RepID=UPI0008DCCA33|nr:PREDICTED: 5-methylcytosine rRNA methyltransferase NSUN4 isoform X2 [Bactrocera latifrons]